METVAMETVVAAMETVVVAMETVAMEMVVIIHVTPDRSYNT